MFRRKFNIASHEAYLDRQNWNYWSQLGTSTEREDSFRESIGVIFGCLNRRAYRAP